MGGLSHTVSGDIASFRTPSRVPIESMKFHFLPKQAAGTPSPENPISIEGWTGVNGKKSNKGSLFEQGGLADATGIPSGTSSTRIRTDFIPYNGEAQLIFDEKGFENDDKIRAIYWYDSSKSFISMSMLSKALPYTYTVPSNDSFAYFRIVLWKTVNTDSISPTGKWLSVNQSLIPITFPDGETIYGGYADPVRGKLVGTCAYKTIDGTAKWVSSTMASEKYRYYVAVPNIKWGASVDSIKACNIFLPVIQGDYKEDNIIMPGRCNQQIYVLSSEIETVEDLKDMLNITPVSFVYELIEPIEYDINPITLQAFLDYNNFWSDTNGITEVTYAITESKDILATRKKSMDFDIGHHKKAKWNQLVKDGNFTGNSIDGARWRASHDTKGTLSISNNIAEWECIEVPAYYYQAGITWIHGSNYNYLQIPYNHKLYIRVDMRCSKAVSGRIYALVANGMHKYSIAVPIEANTWTTIDGILPERVSTQTGEDDGIVKRFRTVIAGLNSMSDITVGTTYEVKNFMAFDLTQMFGLGNEPQTVAEFERICALNGIDLTTYQPYDTGSDRWLIIP